MLVSMMILAAVRLLTAGERPGFDEAEVEVSMLYQVEVEVLILDEVQGWVLMVLFAAALLAVGKRLGLDEAGVVVSVVILVAIPPAHPQVKLGRRRVLEFSAADN